MGLMVEEVGMWYVESWTAKLSGAESRVAVAASMPGPHAIPLLTSDHRNVAALNMNEGGAVLHCFFCESKASQPDAIIGRLLLTLTSLTISV